MVKELLENPAQTVNDVSYFNCLDSIMENTKVIPEIAQYFELLIIAAISTASQIPSYQQQQNLLDQTKVLAESTLQMLYTDKEVGEKPKEALEEAKQMMKKVVKDLTTLNETASAAGVLGGVPV
ncbi:hypothetical protein BTVI_145372 [Pitangus sulphuratus]|nr:hypothetical protein BTVI_145372 [Pitangus sulphuratus]